MPMDRPLATIYIVRHGETELNVQRRLQGQSDSPLTAKGIAQAEALRTELSHVRFDAVFSSDLLRAKRTAEILTLEHDLAVTTHHMLREKSYGHLEGKQYEEFEAKFKSLWDRYHKLEETEKMKFKLSEEMESDDEAVSRYLTYVREIAVSHPGKSVLIVSHGGIMKAVLVKLGVATYAELPSGAVQNCGYFSLRSDGVDFFIDTIRNITISR